MTTKTKRSDIELMDAKHLFRIYHSKFYLTNWLRADGKMAQSDGEVNWVYCGVREDFRLDLVSQTIENTFQDDEVYLFISSSNSSLVTKEVASIEIGKYLHKKEIGVMDKAGTKMIDFATYGVFKVGIIREFATSRPKPENVALKVEFDANIVDSSTSRVSGIVRNRFETLSKELNKDYGGSVEHLWIDLELVESHLVKRDPYAFRFQKRVSISDSYTEFYSYNVCHYSVKPDFEKLRNLQSDDSVCSYVFELLYESTQILVDKQKTLNGFDAQAFRNDFLFACAKLKYFTPDRV